MQAPRDDDLYPTDPSSNGQITGVDTAGVLDRYQWGLDGMGFTVGKMIRVTNDIALDGQPPAAH